MEHTNEFGRLCEQKKKKYRNQFGENSNQIAAMNKASV